MSGGKEKVAGERRGTDRGMVISGGKLDISGGWLEAADGTPLVPDPAWSGTIKFRGKDGKIHQTRYHDGDAIDGYGAPSGGGAGPSCCSCGG